MGWRNPRGRAWWLWTALAAAACTGHGADDPFTDASAPGDDDDDDAGPTTATGDIVPNFQFTDQDFEGGRVTTYMPDDPTGVLFVFHGTNGDIASVTQIEWIELYDLLAPHGVGFVLSNSVDRVEMQWDTNHQDGAANEDFPRLDRLRDHLIDTTGLEADTPVLSIGFSNGANFATLFANMAFADGWPFRAFDAHQGGMYVDTPVPGIFVSAVNDESGGTPDQLGPLSEACTSQTARTCPHYTGHEIPLVPLRFDRLPTYSAEQSQAIFDELVDMQIVAEDGSRVIDLADMEDVFTTYIHDSQAPSPSMVPTQLRVVWATHRFSSEHADQEADWLLDQL